MPLDHREQVCVLLYLISWHHSSGGRNLCAAALSEHCREEPYKYFERSKQSWNIREKSHTSFPQQDGAS